MLIGVDLSTLQLLILKNKPFHNLKGNFIRFQKAQRPLAWTLGLIDKLICCICVVGVALPLMEEEPMSNFLDYSQSLMVSTILLLSIFWHLDEQNHL